VSRPREFPERPPDVSGLSDQELMELAREWRQEGFLGLVRRYEPAVSERIHDLVRDQDLTDDLLQTTWEKAFAALQKTEPRNFKAWVLRIAYNAAIDELRKKRPDTAPLEVNSDPTARGSAAFAAPVEGRAASNEAKLTWRELEVRTALRELPRHQHRCLYLQFFEDRTVEEIAQFLHLPPGTVKTHLFRGKENLERILGTKAHLLLSNSTSSDPFYTPPPDQS
jgi:RNA polymerase sigma-70 factor (ECF subfamily)